MYVKQCILQHYSMKNAKRYKPINLKNIYFIISYSYILQMYSDCNTFFLLAEI